MFEYYFENPFRLIYTKKNEMKVKKSFKLTHVIVMQFVVSVCMNLTMSMSGIVCLLFFIFVFGSF